MAPARKRSNYPSQVDSVFTAAAATTANDSPSKPSEQLPTEEKPLPSAHQDILSAIYGNASDEHKGVTAKDAAAANLDKCAIVSIDDWLTIDDDCPLFCDFICRMRYSRG